MWPRRHPRGGSVRTRPNEPADFGRARGEDPRRRTAAADGARRAGRAVAGSGSYNLRNCHTLLYSFRVGAGEYGIYRTTSTRSAPLNAMSAISAPYEPRPRWVGRGLATVVPVHHRKSLFLFHVACVGALKAKPTTESERPRQ